MEEGKYIATQSESTGHSFFWGSGATGRTQNQKCMKDTH